MRPQVLPRELQRDLVELLDFRHFFRRAYGVNLDPGRLRGNLDRMIRVDPLASAALDLFDAFLQRAQGALAE